MYIYKNQLTTSQGEEDTYKADKLLIQSFQRGWDKEQRGD